jgi:hypothetical protein
MELSRAMDAAGASTTDKRPPLRVVDQVILAMVFIVAVVAAAGPVLRILYRVEINYSEGWNAYNAQLALGHQLYPGRYSWTTVNYPFLSFYLIGNLARLGGDALMVGRWIALLSLLVSCVVVGMTVQKLARCRWAAIFSCALGLTLFSAMAPDYIGADDPQLLAQALGLLALFIYLRGKVTSKSIAVVALIFVLSLNVKQNLIAAPLAVLLDLLLSSRVKAGWFVLCGAVLGAFSVAVNIWVEGSFYIAQLLTPRIFLMARVLFIARHIISIVPAVVILLAIVVRRWCDARFRVVILYSITALVAAIFFYGAVGVNVNVFFDLFFAVSIAVGVMVARFQSADLAPVLKGNDRKWVVTLLLLVPLLIWLPPLTLHVAYAKYVKVASLGTQEKQFALEADFLRSKPGPAICESLLRCYYAGKPYLFDPFNATSLVTLGKLDGGEMARRIENKEFSVIQTSLPVAELPRTYERMPAAFLDAIDRNYRVALQEPDCVIYVPQ